jgi:hypothetical protein
MNYYLNESGLKGKKKSLKNEELSAGPGGKRRQTPMSAGEHGSPSVGTMHSTFMRRPTGRENKTTRTKISVFRRMFRSSGRLSPNLV